MADDERATKPPVEASHGDGSGAGETPEARGATAAGKSRLIDEVNRELAAFREAADRLDEAVARQFGLNRTDLRCIGIVYRSGRLTAGELADESGLSPGAITTALDRIERAGYANRVADPQDRRRVVVVSTQATRELGARLYGEVEVSGNALLQDRSVSELGLIRDYLGATRAVYERQAAHLSAPASGDDAPAVPGSPGVPEASAPLGDTSEGRLEFTRGASKVVVSGGAAPGELYHAHFEGPPPEVSVHGGAIVMQRRRAFLPFDWRQQSSEVQLNTSIPWTIVLKGGMYQFTADLRGLRLSGLEVGGGASDIEVWLPAPVGVVPVRLSGGASKVVVHRPRGVPLRAAMSGGASHLVFDGQSVIDLGGRNILESSGYEAHDDRYELRFSGGASQLTIDAV